MKDVKNIIAENLTQLRKAQGLTQAQLAEKFNYSDKAICRWEHGETLPDINTLYALCEFYRVTMNDLVSSDFEATDIDKSEKEVFKYRILTTAMVLAALWLLAVVVFITTIAYGYNYWIIFIWGVPVSCILILRLWRHHGIGVVPKIILHSIIIWTTITAVFLHLLCVTGVNAWMFYLIGLPMQCLVIIWQKLKEYRTNI